MSCARLATTVGGMSILVSADELRESLRTVPVPVVLDVRWELGRADGHARYLDGHIPGAIFVDLDTELSGLPSREDGRHPLPDVDILQENARRWGIRRGASVVVYDTIGGTSASRAWWLLRWAGIEDVRILDGGLQAWRAIGGAEAQGPGNLPRRGDVELTEGNMPVIDCDEAAEWPTRRGPLVDVRVAERFRGEREPVDPQAGHIPGAINLPSFGNLDDEGRFLPAVELRERFARVGITDPADTAVYCGSGVHATHTIAAMEIAGMPRVTLFAGAWSKWAGDRARPVERG